MRPSDRHILNIAHRGFTKDFPDNTLEAFQAAIELGADGVEFDVRETADGHFVIFHDAELNGEEIASVSLAELQSVRLGGKYRIPTLEETLELCRGRTKMMVEVKNVASLDRFLSLLKEKSDLEDVVIASFDPDLVLKLSYSAPDLKRAIITATAVEDPVALGKRTHSDIVAVRFPVADPFMVARAYASGLGVYVWGLTTRDIRQAIEMDVDGIVSDYPDMVKRELAAGRDRKQGYSS